MQSRMKGRNTSRVSRRLQHAPEESTVPLQLTRPLYVEGVFERVQLTSCNLLRIPARSETEREKYIHSTASYESAIAINGFSTPSTTISILGVAAPDPTPCRSYFGIVRCPVGSSVVPFCFCAC